MKVGGNTRIAHRAVQRIQNQRVVVILSRRVEVPECTSLDRLSGLRSPFLAPTEIKLSKMNQLLAVGFILPCMLIGFEREPMLDRPSRSNSIFSVGTLETRTWRCRKTFWICEGCIDKNVE